MMLGVDVIRRDDIRLVPVHLIEIMPTLLFHSQPLFDHCALYVRSEEGSKAGSTYTDAEQASNLRTGLARLRQNGVFCDVTFLVEDKSYSCHKCVLAASSDYFAAMFAGGFKEDELKDVPLEGVTAVSFNLVLDYVYTGSIQLYTDIVRGLYETADLLQFPRLKKMYFDFLLKDIQAQSCLDYLSMAEIHSLSEVKKLCEGCIFQNFYVLSKMPKFGDLPFVVVSEMLASDNLCIQSEMVVRDGLCGWMEHHSDLHQDQKDQLIEHLHYGLLTGDDIQRLQNFHTALGSDTCQRLKDKLLAFLMNPKEQPL